MVSSEEYPDTTLTKARRNTLKSYVHNVEWCMNKHDLMYLAGAFEDAARRKELGEKQGERDDVS